LNGYVENVMFDRFRIV